MGLKDLLKSPSKEMVKGVIDGAAEVVDRFTLSNEERLQFKAELDKEITKRWQSDMASDSWLSKNVRPLTLAFLILSTVFLIIADSGFIDFVVKDTWISLLNTVLMVVITAYFGGRSFEKIKRK